MVTINNIFNIFKTTENPHTLLQDLYPLGEIGYTMQELEALDFEFFYGVAGSRMPSPLITREEGLDENHHIKSGRKTMLEEIIKVKFLKSWERIFETLTAEYNPVENYSLTEQGTDKKTGDDTTTDKSSPVDNYIQTDDTVFGYDSSTATPSSGEKVSTSKNYESKTDFNNTLTHNFTRTGNIGVMTGAQMVENETDVRIKKRLADIIYNDLKNLLTLQVF